MPNARLLYLFEQYIAKTCTVEEKQELAELLLSPEHAEEVQELMLQTWETTDAANPLADIKADQIFVSIIHATNPASFPMERGAKVRRMWKRFAAAAIIIAMLAGSSYYLLNLENKNELAETKPQEKNLNPAIAAPTQSKATITLADGSIVTLDSTAIGTLATQGNTSVTKTTDGKIIYNSLQKPNGTIQFNTLTNPKGSTVVDMTLSDGSRVWLNAGSSVTYPVTFAGIDRKISITGEAYFEVAHNALHPFTVEKGEMRVEVLGTHFNINAYEDETDIKVTLLEGSVKVSNAVRNVLIKPAQQAILRQGQDYNAITIVKNVDVDQVMAWKNGLFEFNDTELPVIMRQVARWYDIEVAYEGKPTYAKFGGGLSRKLPLTNVLKLLEANGLRFSVEGKKVTVIY